MMDAGSVMPAAIAALALALAVAIGSPKSCAMGGKRTAAEWLRAFAFTLIHGRRR